MLKNTLLRYILVLYKPGKKHTPVQCKSNKKYIPVLCKPCGIRFYINEGCVKQI